MRPGERLVHLPSRDPATLERAQKLLELLWSASVEKKCAAVFVIGNPEGVRADKPHGSGERCMFGGINLRVDTLPVVIASLSLAYADAMRVKLPEARAVVSTALLDQVSEAFESGWAE